MGLWDLIVRSLESSGAYTWRGLVIWNFKLMLRDVDNLRVHKGIVMINPISRSYGERDTCYITLTHRENYERLIKGKTLKLSCYTIREFIWQKPGTKSPIVSANLPSLLLLTRKLQRPIFFSSEYQEIR